MRADEGTILIVDDQEANRLLLSRFFERKGYAVRLAADGREALDIVAREPIALILLDIMMPGIDGIDVLEAVRENASPTVLPVIMVTARDETEDVVRALTLGANDYLAKPLDLPIVLARVRTQMSLRAATAALHAAHARMERDLAAAARIQQALLPRSDPGQRGVRFAWKVEPCDELAGDTLDILVLDRDRTGVYLADVSGHGVPAALLSVTLCHLLSPLQDNALLYEPGQDGLPPRPRPPAEVVDRLNAQFQIDLETTQYFTIAYGILDAPRRELRYVCAGHPGPIVVRADGSIEVEAGEDLPVGWAADPGFHEQRLRLEPGDRVYLHSDGLLEARDGSGTAFGLDRLLAALDRGRSVALDDSLADVCDAVTGWSNAPLADDVSILGLEISTPDDPDRA